MDDIRQGTCPVCMNNEVIESVPTIFVGEPPWEIPLAVTRLVTGRGPDPASPFGVLSLFTCRRCGYSQIFAAYPGSIPIGPEARTRLHKGPDPAPPYRSPG
jgi:hypothetical protein